MLSITSSQPVHWPPSPGPSVAPVSPVGSVAPAHSQTREQASGFGSGREDRASAAPDTTQDRRTVADKAASESQAAPLLPRQQPEGGQQGEATASAELEKTREQAREAQAKAEEKAAEQPPLQEVLTSVWRASAAVVDVILGREVSSSTQALAASGAAGAGAGVGPGEAAAKTSGVTAVPATAAESAVASASGQPWQLPSSEPVTYTDQGTSVWDSIETGTLVNQKA